MYLLLMDSVISDGKNTECLNTNGKEKRPGGREKETVYMFAFKTELTLSQLQ